MLRIFIGYDDRQPVSFTALSQSIIETAKQPVTISPLVLDTLPIKRRGLTPFTYSRFLVPYLCEYKGWALFLDADMIVTDDIGKIFAFADESKAIHVAKNVERFEWASLMLFNCDKCTMLTPEVVETHKRLHTIEWVDQNLIGDIPQEWNHLVGYDTPKTDPKLIHYTQGVPAFPETNTCEHADLWYSNIRKACHATSWAELMGPSVHAVHLQLPNGSSLPIPKYMVDVERKVPKPEFMDKIKELVGDVMQQEQKHESIIAMP